MPPAVWPRSAAPRVPSPVVGHCWPVFLQETLKHSKDGLAQSLWGLQVHTRFFFWALWTSLKGTGFDSKCNFAPPTIFLGLLLCRWMWVSFCGGIQHSPVYGYSAASCTFGVLAGDKHTSFYSTVLCSPLKGSYTIVKLDSFQGHKASSTQANQSMWYTIVMKRNVRTTQLSQ